MNPYLRIGLRAGAVALGAFLGSVVGAQDDGLTTAELIEAAYVGYGGFMTYIGLGTFTNLEPTLGIKGVRQARKRRR